MALKTILLRRKLSEKQTAKAALEETRSSYEQREAELADAIEEAKTEEELAAVEEAVTELETSQADVKEKLDAIQGEIDALVAEIEEAEAAQAEAVGEDPAEEGEEEETEGEARSRRRGEKRNMNRMDIRAAEEFKRTGRHSYKNVRSLVRSAVTTASNGVVGPTGVDGINDPVAPASSLVDLVHMVDATGMSQYKVAVMTADATDAAITEGTVPTESEPAFDAVTFTPANYGLISYVSREIRKQSPLNYEEKVTESSRKALRKRLNALIAAAVPASSLADTFALVAASTATTGAELFDANLLSNIILAYGGDEGVDGQATLVLNKADLKAFAAVRGTNEFLPVYSIVPDTASPSTGVIKDNNGLSCRYCISKDVAALSTLSLTTTAKKSMFYANLQAVDLPIWGSLDVEVNDGYKFGEGLLTIRGEVTADADLVVKGGAVVVTAKKGS